MKLKERIRRHLQNLKRIAKRRDPVGPYRCVGGPFDGADIWMTLVSGPRARTTTFRVGIETVIWYGYYQKSGFRETLWHGTKWTKRS